ncbi:hypothetical protein D9V34_02280 [Mycetocola lacteus]|uniref:Abi family protein n=1 Tax=Mycetocola lacteus TaxID=76637 RepID=A0A3L7AUK9_9MICO|nr:hypothetical protein D9V34_02280 [Mycetocola lacteus]
MRVYLDATQGNERDALVLYRWHSDLVAALHSVLGDTEVVLRNAMDRQLQIWNDAETGGIGSWLLHEPASPLRSLTAAKRKDALRRLHKLPRNPERDSRSGVSHDDVVAQLTFGVWKDLLPNHLPAAGNSFENTNRRRIWQEALIQAFPNAPDDGGEATFWRVNRLHQLRNRVSHLEPLLQVNIADAVRDAFGLVRSIDAHVADWVTGGSHVAPVLARRPEFRKGISR